MVIAKPSQVETVRICLNNRNYTIPSGGYKAHSQSRKGAFSHESGFGMEEWINSSINLLTPTNLRTLNIDTLNKTAQYRVAFIEAYKITHYPSIGSKSGKFHGIPRNHLRDVDLVINDRPNSWLKIGEIKNLRGLSSSETINIFQHFKNSGVTSQMDADIASSVKAPFNIIKVSTFQPTDVFNCIFAENDLHLFSHPTQSRIIPKRYRWRY